MRRWIGAAGVLVIGAMVLGTAGAVLPVRADDPIGIVQNAYDAYADWQTYQFQVNDTSRYALVVDGKTKSLWQTQEGDATLTGWYDMSNPADILASFKVTGNSSDSTETAGERVPLSWSVDADVALVNGETLWRGTYKADPEDSFTLPQDWEPFDLTSVDKNPGIASLMLSRYLRQNNRDPFMDDYQGWLDAADSVDGPTTVKLDRTTQGDAYTITVNLADAPQVLEDRFHDLTDGPDAVVDRDVLMEALLADSTLVWSVVLDPSTDTLLAQRVQLDLSAELSGDALLDGYASFSLAYSDDQSVMFSNVNEPVDISGLPG